MAPGRFAGLSEYSRIVVTGPQRSGTTIAAKMVAADTGHTYIDEDDFGITDVTRFDAVLAGHRIVVQAPHMLRRVADHPPAGTLIVLMRRPVADIHASERRISWGDGSRRAELRALGASEGDPATLKYAYWDRHAGNVPNLLELSYADLAGHPLYVPSEQRVAFGPRQTEVR